MGEVLNVASLVTRLRNGARIVDDISFGIRRGETFALLGESGCGKSMTALSLMRLLPDSVHVESGAVQLEGADMLSGTDILALPEREMREVRGGRMAMIFQEPGLSLNPVMTVGAQIAEALELHGAKFSPSPQPSPVKGEGAGSLPPRGGGLGRGGDAIKQRGIELLNQVGIPDAPRRWHEYPFQMSGGMKQRVMIAMALAGQPELLIADEPTTALDVTIQAQVLQLLRDTQKENGMAMLLITHDLGVVAQMAHQVAVMYAGHIVELAPREKLFSSPAHPYTQKLFAALPDARRRGQPLAAIPGNVPPLHDIPHGCRFAPRCDRAWALCHEQAPEWTVLDTGQGVRCHLYGRIEERGLRSEGRGARIESQPLPLAGEGNSLLAPQSPLLQVEDLQVHFPIRKGILQRTAGQVMAVDGLSLEIGAGRTLALVGESGCGKTTVGKALLQLIRPTAGSVRFAGNELVGLDASSLRQQRAGMQMIFQDPYASLNPRMRVAEILEEGMEALGKFLPPVRGGERSEGASRMGVEADDISTPTLALPLHGGGDARQSHIDELLKQVGLDSAAKWRYPHEFSGGQRQRIAIARALAVSPKLLICDEPTSALDVSVQAQILNLLKSLQQELNLSYLFISHNLAVVEYLAHEVCVMYLGRIVERGTAEEILRAPKHPYTRALLSAVPHIDGRGMEIIRLAGDMPSPANPPLGCHFHPRCPQAMPVCREIYPQASTSGAMHLVHCHLYGSKE